MPSIRATTVAIAVSIIIAVAIGIAVVIAIAVAMAVSFSIATPIAMAAAIAIAVVTDIPPRDSRNYCFSCVEVTDATVWVCARIAWSIERLIGSGKAGRRAAWTCHTAGLLWG